MWTKIHDLLALPDERGWRNAINLKEEAQRCYILEWLIPKFSCLWRNHHEVFRKLPKSSPKPWPLELQSRSKGKLTRVRKLSMGTSALVLGKWQHTVPFRAPATIPPRDQSAGHRRNSVWYIFYFPSHISRHSNFENAPSWRVSLNFFFLAA